MSCLGLLTEEIEPSGGSQPAHRAGWSEHGVDLRPSLYRRVLGTAYDRQSRAGQALHDAGPSRWEGRCRLTVQRG